MYLTSRCIRLGPHASRSHDQSGLLEQVQVQYFDFKHHEARYYESGRQLSLRMWPEETCADCSLETICGGVEIS